MHRLLLVIALALVTITDCAPGLAADPLGFYLGGGVGHSQVRNDLDFSGFAVPGSSGPYSINGSTTGWKLLAGIRPLPILGTEVAYTDFGSVNGAASLSATPTHAGLSVTAASHPKAAALFAVGYLPIPLPRLEVFAKAGVAQLKSGVRATGQATCLTGLLCDPVFVTYSANGNGTHAAYGAGAQLKFASVAMRAEYERISASSGDVDLLSFGLTFAF